MADSRNSPGCADMGRDLPQGGRAAVSLDAILDECINLLLAGRKCLHDIVTCHMECISNDIWQNGIVSRGKKSGHLRYTLIIIFKVCIVRQRQKAILEQACLKNKQTGDAEPLYQRSK